MDYLEKLHFTMIHLRLTNDQSFAIQLHSRPELALPSPKDTRMYNGEELKELALYAKKRGIMIVPEIQVQSHAGSWLGIPGLLVACPNYTCSAGDTISVNTTNPELFPVLKDVIGEVRDIFDTPPFLHLGGNDIELSKAYYEELGVNMPDPFLFERHLEGILIELDIPLDNVLRYGDARNGKTTDKQSSYEATGQSSFAWTGNQSAAPLFASSTSLSMDANGEDNGWAIYQHARLLTNTNNVTELVVRTSKLHPRWWGDRNVWADCLPSPWERKHPWE